ncbi:MAG: nicotinamide mononucleotide transporter family protein, partial [Pseudomonadota bacterium]
MPEDLLARLWMGLRATTWPEAIAVLLGLAYVLLALKQNRWCWVAGGASSLILAWLSARSRLPMQALLQLWYVGMAVYGWRQWSRPQGDRIGTWPARLHAAGIAAALLLSLLVARWLASETQAAWPYLDSATTVLSLLATWLVARM